MLHEKMLSRAKAGTGAAVNFSGKWQNELGSVATITQNGNVLSETYVSAVSEGGDGATGELSGYADGGLIAFVVDWDQYQAITAWVGQTVPDVSPVTVTTLWQMTSQVPDGDEWAAINAGADTFIQIS